MMRSRIPYPDLPLPVKFKKVIRAPKPAPLPRIVHKPIIREQPRPVASRLQSMAVLEPKIGGELEPEPPKAQDNGAYIVESLDLGDY